MKKGRLKPHFDVPSFRRHGYSRPAVQHADQYACACCPPFWAARLGAGMLAHFLYSIHLIALQYIVCDIFFVKPLTGKTPRVKYASD
ncbi:MAG: hypothetical protein Q4G28_03750 [Neisseria sp.]|nr:hypothetical protein [Neisseria sp.]